MLTTAVLVCPACDPVAYDFSYTIDAGEPEVDGGVCADLVADTVFCGAVDLVDGGCVGLAEPAPLVLGEALGCTPEGQSLGAMSFRVVSDVDPDKVDLYAWVAAPHPGLGPFHGGAYLNLFGDLCGASPMHPEGACEYRPWIARENLSTTDPAFLHVQTAGDAVAVDYQIRQSGTWSQGLPASGQDLSCLESGPLGDQLVGTTWWQGVPVTVDFSGAAPAWEDGDSWICPADAGGWRQAAFRLHAGINPEDQLWITRVHVRDPVSSEPVDHHLAIFQCAIDGEVDPSYPGPVAWDCNDEGDHPAKDIDVLIPAWNNSDFNTEFALVLQLPPVAAPQVEIQFTAEVL